MSTRTNSKALASTGSVNLRNALLLILCALSTPALSMEASAVAPSLADSADKTTEAAAARASTDRTGVLQTTDGLTLRLTTDLGSVHITSIEPGAPPVVRYTVHIETDARAPLSQHLLDHYLLTAKSTASGVEINGALPSQTGKGTGGAQFWVQFEVAVPVGYNVEVNTDVGDIETEDIGGTATLITQGGNIRAGRIGVSGIRTAAAGRPVAKLETQGGHIQVMDVAGDLSAFTAGGHIHVGNIAGDASLRTGGGHIHAGQIGGRAELETVGGNIVVGHAGAFVKVRTGGGQIDFGEVRGSVRAQTGGGGIRIMYVSGPMEVESSSGSICLTRVAGAVQAATAGGTITAWISPDTPSSGGAVHLAGPSQLASGAGDIIVFLPRNLAANIDATVETGGERRIEADPALALAIQALGSRAAGPVHATGALNGGGPVLKLRTTAGKIRLEFLDTQTAWRDSLIRDQQARLASIDSDGMQFERVKVTQPAPSFPASPPPESKGDWLDAWMDRLEIAFTGSVREDIEDFQKRLIYSPRPSYPEIAKRAGLQGIVRLQVRVKKNETVEVEKVLEGEPALADAAIAAVNQWRAKPAWVNSKLAEVVSIVTFNFQLH
jgi:TonB family protein